LEYAKQTLERTQTLGADCPDYRLFRSLGVDWCPVEFAQDTVNSLSFSFDFDFFAGHIFFIVSFVVLWILVKKLHKSAMIVSIVATLIMVVLSFFIFQRWVDGNIIMFFVNNLRFYFSIFIINYAVVNKFSALKSSMFLFASFLVLFFFHYLHLHFFSDFGPVLFDFYDGITFIIFSISAGIYFAYSSYLEKKVQKIE
jgi:hypothetical protein